MIILGIDPGTATIGYGIIEIKKTLKAIDYGCIKTSVQDKTTERLKVLYQELNKIIKKHQPDLIAVEDIFFFKNAKTAIKVSQARGVILLAAANFKIPVYEPTPLQIKLATVGYGRAEKQQVQKMVQKLLQLKTIPKPDDAADALAIAICGAHSINNKIIL